MKLIRINLLLTFSLILIINPLLLAQSTRGLVNDGVESYNEQKYSDAEVNFKKGTEAIRIELAGLKQNAEIQQW